MALPSTLVADSSFTPLVFSALLMRPTPPSGIPALPIWESPLFFLETTATWLSQMAPPPSGQRNLTLTWNSSIVYWNQGLNSSVNAILKSPVLKLQSIGILQLLGTNLTGAVIVAYSSDYAEGDVLRTLKFDSDGNLRIYSNSRGTGTSTARWATVQDQCKVFGFCGTNGICSYNDSNPVCGCPSQNFEMIDPNDSRKGGNCLAGSCFASTSLSDGTGQCYIKTSHFISGYQSLALPSTSYVKVCGWWLQTHHPRGKRWGVPAWVVVVVILNTLLGLMVLEGGLWLWCCRNNKRFGRLSAQLTLLEYASGAPVQSSYKELQRSTKGFKEKLGAVYRGTLANKTVVAVKQLEQGEKQFRMEVATISSTHHLNLVRLIGFCSQGRHRLLVYEFMKNESLDKFLYGNEEQSGKLLSWQYRFNIALGTARSIMYLNEECLQTNKAGILSSRPRSSRMENLQQMHSYFDES
ncbi:hypothetical protein L6164_007046 [Bauhinia variegata]|uniref:Uncharacterized protein n=1 Tax=Bauhinia variegata TaxID=167791 RepID=A0ACB9PYF3_BAUVA|nr:hypothetical protein L6164_007046 [Bauhinia variegata]